MKYSGVENKKGGIERKQQKKSICFLYWAFSESVLFYFDFVFVFFFLLLLFFLTF
jgi:hypothetical protein